MRYGHSDEATQNYTECIHELYCHTPVNECLSAVGLIAQFVPLVLFFFAGDQVITPDCNESHRIVHTLTNFLVHV